MTDDSTLDTVLEAALHSYVAQRCERAYVHELRNSMQAIYASVDVFTRMLSGKQLPNATPEKAKEMARNAIDHHERGLERTVKNVVVQNDAPTAIRVDDVLRELAAFLSNDATAHSVTLEIASDDANVEVAPSKFRVAMLCVIVRSIDTLRHGGQLNIVVTGAEDAVSIDFSMTSAGEIEEKLWRVPGAEASWRDDWIIYALQKMIAKDRGTIRFARDELAHRCTVKLRYPATPIAN